MFMARITEKLMEPPIVEYWTPEECSAGLCLPEDIGKARSPLVEARKLTQLATLKAVKALVEVAEQNDDLGAKVKAASLLLDRGWGKPDQHVSTENTNVHVYPAWIKPTRLAYQIGQQVGADITDPEYARVRDEKWTAALVEYVEANPDDNGARQGLASVRARLSGDPLLPPPEPE
jgi:hypothetical protein